MTPRERLRAAASSPWMRLVLGVAISATVLVLWMRGLHRSKFMTVEWRTTDLAHIPTQKGMWCVTFHAHLRASQQLHHCASRSSQKTLESWQSLSLTGPRLVFVVHALHSPHCMRQCCTACTIWPCVSGWMNILNSFSVHWCWRCETSTVITTYALNSCSVHWCWRCETSTVINHHMAIVLRRHSISCHTKT